MVDVRQTGSAPVGQHVSMVVPPDRLEELQTILENVAGGTAVTHLATERIRRDGKVLQVRISVWPLFDDDGVVFGASAVTHDVTAEVLAAQERDLADQRFQAAFRRSTFGMAITDLDGHPSAVNPAICEMLGRSPDELIGRRWTGFTHPEDIPRADSLLAELRAGVESSSTERRFIRPDGSLIWLEVNAHVIRDSGERPLYLMVQMQDISARKAVEAEMAHRALHDGLTGLPHRLLLADRLEHTLAASTRSGGRTGVIFLDVDDFKRVNDTLGHEAGDQLLVEVADRLRRCVRPSDTVARFGGDEFVLVCGDVTEDSVAALVTRVTVAMAAQFSIEGSDVPLQTSAGVTLSGPNSTVRSLLSEADAAMYRAKELGRGRVAVFDRSVETPAIGAHQPEGPLRTRNE